MSLTSLKIMEAPKTTLLVMERNSFSRFTVFVQFKHSINTVTHVATVPSVDLLCHPHLSCSLCPQQVLLLTVTSLTLAYIRSDLPLLFISSSSLHCSLHQSSLALSVSRLS